jgi:hypothetical protein
MSEQSRMADETKRVAQEYQHQAERAEQQFQHAAQTGFETALRSWGELNKGWTALAAEWTEYSKNAFNEGTHALERLVGARTIDDVVQIQSEYAKKAYDEHVAEVSKLGQMRVDVVQNAYKPAEEAVRKGS